MLNSSQLLNDYLAEQIEDLPTVYNDLFPEANGDSVICRYDPSQAVEKRFCDGSRNVKQQFSYYARSTDATKARKYLDEIINVLDTKDLIRVSDNFLVQCEAITLPQFISVDDNNNTIYTATVEIEYVED